MDNFLNNIALKRPSLNKCVEGTIVFHRCTTIVIYKILKVSSPSTPRFDTCGSLVKVVEAVRGFAPEAGDGRAGEFANEAVETVKLDVGLRSVMHRPTAYIISHYIYIYIHHVRNRM